MSTDQDKCNCVLCRFTDVLNWKTNDEVKTEDLFVGIDTAVGQDKTVISLRKNGKTSLVINAMIDEAVAVETGYNADGRLKAYWVQCKDDEWGMWIHAESAGKAKSIYHQQDPSLEPASFTELRALRPGRGADLLDCTPFTDDTLKLAGYPRNVDIDDFPEAFLDFCPCSMCRFEKTKPEYQVGYQKAMA